MEVFVVLFVSLRLVGACNVHFDEQRKTAEEVYFSADLGDVSPGVEYFRSSSDLVDDDFFSDDVDSFCGVVLGSRSDDGHERVGDFVF